MSLIIKTKTECELVFSYKGLSYTAHYTYKNNVISAISKGEDDITTFKGSIEENTMTIVYDNGEVETVFTTRK